MHLELTFGMYLYKEFSGACNIIGQLHSEGVHSVSYTLYAPDKMCNNSASYLYVPNCRVVKNCIMCCELITQCLQTTYPGWAPWCGEWHLLLIHMSYNHRNRKASHISVAVVARKVLGHSVTSTLPAPSWQWIHQKVVHVLSQVGRNSRTGTAHRYFQQLSWHFRYLMEHLQPGSKQVKVNTSTSLHQTLQQWMIGYQPRRNE